jgi:hypothetical protein
MPVWWASMANTARFGGTERSPTLAMIPKALGSAAGA